MSSRETISKIEEDLNIPKGFFNQLLREGDDWSFIIKIHSLLEAATAYHLMNEINKNGLNSVLIDLEMNQKIDFIEALNTFDKKCRKYLKNLSKLRNKIVHDIKMIKFNLKDYVKNQDKNQLKEFVDAFSLGIKDEIKTTKGIVKKTEIVKSNPRESIWLGCLYLLEGIYCYKMVAGEKRKLEGLYKKVVKDLAEIFVTKKS